MTPQQKMINAIVCAVSIALTACSSSVTTPPPAATVSQASPSESPTPTGTAPSDEALTADLLKVGQDAVTACRALSDLPVGSAPNKVAAVAARAGAAVQKLSQVLGQDVSGGLTVPPKVKTEILNDSAYCKKAIGIP